MKIKTNKQKQKKEKEKEKEKRNLHVGPTPLSWLAKDRPMLGSFSLNIYSKVPVITCESITFWVNVQEIHSYVNLTCKSYSMFS